LRRGLLPLVIAVHQERCDVVLEQRHFREVESIGLCREPIPFDRRLHRKASEPNPLAKAAAASKK